MAKFHVGLSVVADDTDALMSRITTWDLTDEEGIVSVLQEPEPIVIPPEMQPPSPPQPPPIQGNRHIASVEPNHGPAKGGTQITLHGGGFTNIGGVRFEGANNEQGWAWSFEVVDDNTMTCPTPPMKAGVVTVVAFNGDPGDAVLHNGFTYE